MTTPDPVAPVAGTDVVERPCPDCDGDGFTVRGTCSWCHGTGRWNEEEQNRARYETHPVGTAAEIARLRAEVEELRKPAGETIGWDSETMAELVSARDQIASDRRCERRDECAASSAIFRDCACMRSAVQRRTPR